MTRLVAGLLMCVSAACGSAVSAGADDTTVSGTYTNAEGNASVEFLANGRAHFSLHGVGGQCTFTQSDRNVLLTCEGEVTTFTVEDDGALKGPKDSFLTRLKKKA